MKAIAKEESYVEEATFDVNAKMSPGLERAYSAFRRDLPELLREKKNDRKWVAYDDQGEQIGIDASERKLYQRCLRRHQEGEFLICCIFPEMPENIDSEELIDI